MTTEPQHPEPQHPEERPSAAALDVELSVGGAWCARRRDPRGAAVRIPRDQLWVPLAVADRRRSEAEL